MRCILMGVTRHIEKNTLEREETAVQGYALHPHGVTPVTASRTRQSERRQPYRLCAASSWALTRHIK